MKTFKQEKEESLLQNLRNQSQKGVCTICRLASRKLEQIMLQEQVSDPDHNLESKARVEKMIHSRTRQNQPRKISSKMSIWANKTELLTFRRDFKVSNV